MGLSAPRLAWSLFWGGTGGGLLVVGCDGGLRGDAPPPRLPDFEVVDLVFEAAPAVHAPVGRPAVWATDGSLLVVPRWPSGAEMFDADGKSAGEWPADLEAPAPTAHGWLAFDDGAQAVVALKRPGGGRRALASTWAVSRLAGSAEGRVAFSRARTLLESKVTELDARAVEKRALLVSHSLPGVDVGYAGEILVMAHAGPPGEGPRVEVHPPEAPVLVDLALEVGRWALAPDGTAAVATGVDRGDVVVAVVDLPTGAVRFRRRLERGSALLGRFVHDVSLSDGARRIGLLVGPANGPGHVVVLDGAEGEPIARFVQPVEDELGDSTLTVSPPGTTLWWFSPGGTQRVVLPEPRRIEGGAEILP